MNRFFSPLITCLSTILAAILFTSACASDRPRAVLSGEIIHPSEDSVWLTVNGTPIPGKLNDKNQFELTLDIPEANRYRFDHGSHSYVFLRPGSRLHITLDTENFDTSIQYHGTDLEENAYLKMRILIQEQLHARRKELPLLSESDFQSLMDETLERWKAQLLRLPDIESEALEAFKRQEMDEYRSFDTLVRDYYQAMKKLTPGQPAMDFSLVDGNGHRYSLNDFKQKAICIDVWASWCSACFKEMPHFEKLAQKYEGRDIEFLAVSLDDQESLWKKMLQDKGLQGFQLWAEGGNRSRFFKDYQLKDLPVYIIIDKNGKIVNARAPRPSENLEEVIKAVLKE